MNKVIGPSSKHLAPLPDIHFWAVERIDAVKRFLKIFEQQKIRKPNQFELYQKSTLEEIWEDIWCEREALNLAGQLSIIGLYRIIEIGTLRILKWAYSYLGDQLKAQNLRIFRWKRVKELVKKDFNFNIKEIPFFSCIDELRCLNNDIKHTGKVGEELSQFKGWNKEKDLYFGYYLPNHFERFARIIPKYLEAFLSGVECKLKEKA